MVKTDSNYPRLGTSVAFGLLNWCNYKLQVDTNYYHRNMPFITKDTAQHTAVSDLRGAASWSRCHHRVGPLTTGWGSSHGQQREDVGGGRMLLGGCYIAEGDGEARRLFQVYARNIISIHKEDIILLILL